MLSGNIIYFLWMMSIWILPGEEQHNAHKQIKNLKEGVLLIRLDSGHAKFDLLEESGHVVNEQTKKAYLASKEKVMTETIDAFDKYYKFSKYFFFYDYDQNKILHADFQGVLFNSNKQLVEIDDLNLDSNNIFIAQVGKVIYFDAMNKYYEGLVLKDHQLRQLDNSFPYYVKKHAPLPISNRSIAEMVIVLDEQLDKFY